MARAMVVARCSSSTLPARCPLPLLCAPPFLQPLFFPSRSRSNTTNGSYRFNADLPPTIHLKSHPHPHNYQHQHQRHHSMQRHRTRLASTSAYSSTLGFTTPSESLLPEVCVLSNLETFSYKFFHTSVC